MATTACVAHRWVAAAVAESALNHP
jgi:hypothetical protein